MREQHRKGKGAKTGCASRKSPGFTRCPVQLWIVSYTSEIFFWPRGWGRLSLYCSSASGQFLKIVDKSVSAKQAELGSAYTELVKGPKGLWPGARADCPPQMSAQQFCVHTQSFCLV